MRVVAMPDVQTDFDPIARSLRALLVAVHSFNK